MLSNVYSKSFLQSSSQVAENSVILLRDRFLPLLQKAAVEGTALEVHEMNNAFTMDFMSTYLFGMANSTNFTEDVMARRQFLQLYHHRRPYEVYAQEFPEVIHLAERIGLPLIPQSVDRANEEIESWCMRMCDSASNCLEGSLSPGKEPVVYKQLKTSMEKNQTKGSSQYTTDRMRRGASDMLDQLGAGHETSAVALTYLYWEMSRHPALQQKLRDELLTLEPRIMWPAKAEGEFGLPSSKIIDTLPLLHAIIMETLRLYAPIPGIEPRVTPPGGCTLAGYTNIPDGVRVSAMSYAASSQ